MNKKNEKQIMIKVNFPEEVTLSGLYETVAELRAPRKTSCEPSDVDFCS